MSGNNVQKGKCGEDIARDHLERNGLSIIEHRYRSPYGEIDLVARDKNTLCFVEVKARTSLTAGNPYDSITFQKQKHIKNAAQHYISTHSLVGFEEIRFDVVSIINGPHYQEPLIEWFKHAFHD
jgi:putative endonuclease